ncbi:Malonyl-CoA-acyl carrier protein transacylase; mitochondrial [Camelus dromedarius]|uniref:Malonyl-CoA-acyl carrier protein transacylase, mitochondrial n=1 Tax=Camelus dromedarius TaxID=9838 RepID=A0A5N4DHA2_CAMDR|nr:malonyl-CoA-acyl carrier protein transacylase, mitochondrial [Camelus dromedarius]KAB1270508.1 Malonyl-CoA-acyl carrier protein transacylase; mitochondrial [Camelus dromedarius]
MSVRVARAAWAAWAWGRGASFRRSASNFPLPPTGAVEVAELLRDATTAEEGSQQVAARWLPNQCSVLLFPGQGSQVVGMGRGLLRYPRVRELYAAASRVLGYDLLELSLHGPQEALDRTVHCQPAVFVASLAAVEKLNHLQPTVIENCVAAAGFSVGEFAALVFAGAMEFCEGLYAVKVRAEAMQEASEAVPSGMLSVLGQPQSRFTVACAEAQEHCRTLGIEDPVCELSSYLFPDCRVISGHLQALQFLQKNSSKYHFRRTKLLPVSGGFHTRLMQPAVEPLAQVLKEIDVKKPLVSVHSNVNGNRYMHPKHIQKLLVQQVVSPVKWEQTMHTIYQRKRGTEFPRTFEVGPGKQLGTILKSCNLQAWKSYSHIEVLEADEDLDQNQ